MMREHLSTPDPPSSDSATTTAVNSPATDQFPQDTRTTDNQVPATTVPPRRSGPEREAELSPDSVEGWPQLAQFMAQTPDLAVFPRFRDLQIKSLLYYQCELKNLRKQLHDLEFVDVGKRKRYNQYADDLMEDGIESDQYQKIEEIRTVLKNYSKLYNI